MTFKVFIDGAEGTTGLKIHQYFQKRDDIVLLHIATDKRKDFDERLSMIRKADVSFLCLPDAAAKEIAAAAPKDSRILDTSTAHRTAGDWVYGMPELNKEQRQKIRSSNRVAVPGCHATGAILLIRPLIEAGIVSADYPFSACSLTGYSGGGKKMIAQYEAADRQGTERQIAERQSTEQQIAKWQSTEQQIAKRQGAVTITGKSAKRGESKRTSGEAAECQSPEAVPFAIEHLKSPRQYGIAQTHKHLPEIIAMTNMSGALAFTPIVADYYSGMQVTVPVRGSHIISESGAGSMKTVKEVFDRYYENQPLVRVVEAMDDDGFIAANRLAGTNRLEITVAGNDENLLLIATYDNLGKGASGAAIQNMNIMLGIEETKGLL